jgi:hypothetical protein
LIEDDMFTSFDLLTDKVIMSVKLWVL